jgi:hypothetical protein
LLFCPGQLDYYPRMLCFLPQLGWTSHWAHLFSVHMGSHELSGTELLLTSACRVVLGDRLKSLAPSFPWASFIRT